MSVTDRTGPMELAKFFFFVVQTVWNGSRFYKLHMNYSLFEFFKVVSTFWLFPAEMPQFEFYTGFEFALSRTLTYNSMTL